MEQTRKNFPVLSQYVYANTAAAGLLNDNLLEWRQEHDLDFLIGGSTMKTKAMMEYIPKVRETVASFCGSKTENTALVPNFSIGLNMLLEGLPKNHNVLLLKNDYPSVNWPFTSRGFHIFYVDIDEHLEDRIFNTIKENNISVLALSVVQWVNGIKIAPDFLQLLKEEFPDLIIIADGTQFSGTTVFDFEASAIDVLGTSGYKWLLAGYGNGFMLFKDHMVDQFSVKTIGFNSSDIDLNGRDQVRFAKFFEPGHLDTFNFGSLKFSLDYLEGLGMHAIEAQLNTLSQKAKTAFADLGLLEDAVVKRPSHSTIFKIKDDADRFNKLTDEGVVCSQRGGGVRLSFHFYNTEKDVETIVKILKTTI
ncbi:aminotransferase class V-fold PLP-dependent enzyme [Pareuzebyella sediminis]|uniref:aminotransferase class V-fold PLP-dependent enzyme n=1 Tax=Pareuzebyella sediminis TaxID=2607998 RepID=UPI0011ED5C50|nr:aminotransferase class V-fold PLP-dependent enzyme [Pareuzebyella sediminis]